MGKNGSSFSHTALGICLQTKLKIYGIFLALKYIHRKEFLKLQILRQYTGNV